VVASVVVVVVVGWSSVVVDPGPMGPPTWPDAGPPATARPTANASPAAATTADPRRREDRVGGGAGVSIAG
jgi:hypothetical protein